MKDQLKIVYTIIEKLSRRGLLNWVPDPLFLKIVFYGKIGKKLNLSNPQTFNEKLQWLKLNDRNEIYTIMVDKYLVKEYVADKLGKQYIIPTLGVWERFDQIDFNLLPNQFVLKCTHDSGGLVICKDKASFDIASARRLIEKSLKRNYYSLWREWPYKAVKPRIIAEKYMTDGNQTQELTDYKIHCFNGVPKVILVCRDRFKDMSEDFYYTNWEHIPVKRPLHRNSDTPINKPQELDEMLCLAEKLSKDIPFSRIDFYTIEKKVYFGEITLYPATGMEKFEPEKYDKIFGDWLILPVRGGYLLINDNKYILISEQEESDLKDYKLFCFNGKVKFFKIDFDRFTDHRANYYDIDGNLLPFGEADYPPNPEKHLDMPDELHEMIVCAEKLAENIPFVRIDFYDVNGQVYFGEITFYPASGFGKLIPMEWDNTIGGLIQLPQ